MNDRETKRVLRGLADSAPLILPRYYRPDCCIAATRIALDVLAGFGLTAQAVPAEAIVFNPPYVRRLNAGGKPAQSHEERERFFREDGSHCLGLGMDYPGSDRSTGYVGHLIVKTGRYLLDLSIGQADRPQFGIQIPPVVTRWPEKWSDRDFHTLTVNGSAVGYRAKGSRPTANDYRTSRDWTDEPRRRPAVQAFRKAVRTSLTV
jgi:hypothetical protein